MLITSVSRRRGLKMMVIQREMEGGLPLKVLAFYMVAPDMDHPTAIRINGE